MKNITKYTTIYTDEARAYIGLPHKHETVRYSIGNYVKEEANTNGMKSFWGIFKRGYVGVYHKMSSKHLHRYITEFQERYFYRALHTEQRMEELVRRSAKKQLKYANLIA